jgi:hypothetical protein
MQELALRNNQLASTEDRARFAHEGIEIANQLPYGSNLRRLLREEILKASTLQAESITALAARSSAGRRAGATTRRTELWSALAQATASCPKLASQQAVQMINKLAAPLQDSFFLGRWSDFPVHQVEFWRSLHAVLEGSALAPSDAGEASGPPAHQDLLRAADRLIEEQLKLEQRQQLRAAFREGTVSEEQYLREVTGARNEAAQRP